MEIFGTLLKFVRRGLITDTGQTIMDVLDENMDDLLHLNRVSIASEIKDLLLNNLQIESIWISNINTASTDYKGLCILHENGEWMHINMVPFQSLRFDHIIHIIYIIANVAFQSLHFDHIIHIVYIIANVAFQSLHFDHIIHIIYIIAKVYLYIFIYIFFISICISIYLFLYYIYTIYLV